jgi:hypothetical protein
VDRHEIDAVLRLPFDYAEKILLRAVGDPPAPLCYLHDRLIYRHSPHGHCASVEYGSSHRVDVSTDREIHQRIGPRVDSSVELLQLDPRIVVVGTRSDIGVDLRAQAFPDPYHPAVSTRVPGDNDLAVGNEDPESFGIDPFELRDFLQRRTCLARPCLFDFRQAESPLSIRSRAFNYNRQLPPLLLRF